MERTVRIFWYEIRITRVIEDDKGKPLCYPENRL